MTPFTSRPETTNTKSLNQSISSQKPRKETIAIRLWVILIRLMIEIHKNYFDYKSWIRSTLLERIFSPLRLS